jgi:hypothetical protein
MGLQVFTFTSFQVNSRINYDTNNYDTIINHEEREGHEGLQMMHNSQDIGCGM